MFFHEDECPPGNVFHPEMNLVQSGAPKRLFDKIFGWTYMSFCLNECEFPWNRTSLFPEISKIPEKWDPCILQRCPNHQWLRQTLWPVELRLHLKAKSTARGWNWNGQHVSCRLDWQCSRCNDEKKMTLPAFSSHTVSSSMVRFPQGAVLIDFMPSPCSMKEN